MPKGEKPAAIGTLKQLAASVGLSAASVSYILNGKAAQMKIAPATVKRVQAAAERLRYRPNPVARSLRRQKTDIVGVILSTLGLGWSQGIMDGLQPALESAGYASFLTIHRWSPEREQQEFQSFIERKMDAVITQPNPENGAFYAEMQRSGKIPFLLLGDSLPAWPEMNFVAWNSGPAAQAAVSHLIDLGCRRIAFIGAEYATTMTEARYEGYVNQLKTSGLNVDPRYIAWCPSGEPVAPALERLLSVSPLPDAIFVMNDDLALQTLEYLAAKHIAVPKQIAVASMGDLSPSHLSMVNLTSSREPCEEIGKKAADAILRLLDNPAAPQKHLISCVELAIRGTTIGASQSQKR